MRLDRPPLAAVDAFLDDVETPVADAMRYHFKTCEACRQRLLAIRGSRTVDPATRLTIVEPTFGRCAAAAADAEA